MWTNKQKRTYHTLLSGFKMSQFQNSICRFMTLTTSDLMKESVDFRDGSMNKSFRSLSYRFKRMTPYKMAKQGYIKTKQLKKYYPNKQLNQNLTFNYHKVETNEGNGVLHIVYRGDYCPYTWLSDNWMDIHNSWDVNIRLIRNNSNDVRKASSYIVTQYVAGQKSSYVRSSHSWEWVFRGFKTLWYQIKHWYPNEALTLWNKILLNHANSKMQTTLDSFI